LAIAQDFNRLLAGQTSILKTVKSLRPNNITPMSPSGYVSTKTNACNHSDDKALESVLSPAIIKARITSYWLSILLT
jgi:hypothetical protein